MAIIAAYQERSILVVRSTNENDSTHNGIRGSDGIKGGSQVRDNVLSRIGEATEQIYMARFGQLMISQHRSE